MKEPILFRRDDTLSHEQALYWKDLLYRTVKIGTEVEFALPKGKRKTEWMPLLEHELQPSRDVNNLGRYGVLDIVNEHCGIEIQVLGRQPYYSALLRQYRALFACLPDKIRARPTCGLHYHILSVGLTEPLPEIILANVWNLTRRYAPELRFITSAGETMTALCRRRNYCSHLEMIHWTPGTNTMRQIQQHLKASRSVPEHNNFLNLEHMTFHEDGSIKVLHYENRFPDADLSPTSIVAKTFLFLALLLKAVEMSQYGIIHVGRIHEWRHKIEILNLMSNNNGTLASSDTSRVTPEIVKELQAGCRELLELLRPVLSRFLHNPSLAILGILAETPISLLRASGQSWGQIEAFLSQQQPSGAPEMISVGFDKAERDLMRCIELAELTGCTAVDTWKGAAVRTLFITMPELDSCLQKLDRLRGIRWDAELGAVVFAN